jgi:Uma2 family endonuclease
MQYDGLQGSKNMEAETRKKLFTVDEYYRMAEAGILTPNDRVELIDGEVITMSPIGNRHAGCVAAATHAFSQAFAGRTVVSVQNPLRLSDYTEPEPDIVLLKPRADFYRTKRMWAEDALLVLEVSDTTFAYDRDVKLPRYAAAAIPEVWIEHLEDDALWVYRDPAGTSYRFSLALKGTDSVSVQALADVTFNVADLIG